MILTLFCRQDPQHTRTRHCEQPESTKMCRGTSSTCTRASVWLHLSRRSLTQATPLRLRFPSRDFDSLSTTRRYAASTVTLIASGQIPGLCSGRTAAPAIHAAFSTVRIDQTHSSSSLMFISVIIAFVLSVRHESPGRPIISALPTAFSLRSVDSEARQTPQVDGDRPPALHRRSSFKVEIKAHTHLVRLQQRGTNSTHEICTITYPATCPRPIVPLYEALTPPLMDRFCYNSLMTSAIQS